MVTFDSYVKLPEGNQCNTEKNTTKNRVGCKKKSPFSTNHVAIPTRARILLDWWVISLALTSLTPLTLNLTGARAALAFFVAAVAARLESLSGRVDFLHPKCGSMILVMFA